MADEPITRIKIGNEIILVRGQTSILSEYNIGEKKREEQIKAPQRTTVSSTTTSIPSLSLGVISSTTQSTGISSSSKSVKKKPVKISLTAKQLAPAVLPQSRIRTIMKTAPNVSFLSQETVALAAKAAEIFIKKLAKECYQDTLAQQTPYNEIKYANLTRTAKNSASLGFLKDFLPHKITGREYQRLTGSDSSNSDTKTITNINSIPTSVCV